MALNLAQKDLLRSNDRWRSRVHITIVGHALSIIKDVADDATSITPVEAFAAKYRLDADNPNATVFAAASAWIVSLIDDEDFFGADITYGQIETWLTNEDDTYDAALKAIVAAFFPRIANLVALEVSLSA